MTGSTRRRFAGATSVAALAMLAAGAVGQPASATYPAAANGRIIFGVRTSMEDRLLPIRGRQCALETGVS
jgi:hypothetical protein